MKAPGVMVAIAAGVLVTAGFAVAPASDAAERPSYGRSVKARTVAQSRPALAFTPAAADPRLAAVFARGGLDTSGLRFTPAETRRDNRAVTVAVRARANRADPARPTAPADPVVGLAPIAYNLGVAVGWRRFGIAGDVKRLDMAGRPGGREAADVTVTYAGDRVIGRVKAVADRPFAAVAPSVDDQRSYSLDVGGSYRLTRNVDVTAGLRYRTERDRLVRLDDNRRDSQAVYLGTAFRF
ncbi:MAG: hypothetical protein JWN21_1708 [Sphingomonas bacterium]|uniref:hypothetical protein n=1 Tax=Sphingomonas bacterium TaxID=1895847 RepID=UPI002A67EB1F|nr:hypothetical protein [Sphingomonas bacterium]